MSSNSFNITNITGINSGIINTGNMNNSSIHQSNAFANAFKNNSEDTTTENGMPAYASTNSACLDFFYKAGAMRTSSPADIITLFESARRENEDLALRILLWARDVRGGAGERRLFRTILEHLKQEHSNIATKVLKATPEIGRWDDIYVGEITPATTNMMRWGLGRCDVLFAKWFEVKGERFEILFNGLFSEQIAAINKLNAGDQKTIDRKIYQLKRMLKKHITTVRKGHLVEQKMCAKQWDDINFSHVPSVAMKRYRKLFSKKTENFAKWLESLKKGEKGVKVNAGAIFPHDVIKAAINSFTMSVQEVDAMIQQWNALPNYVGNNNILPMVDTSGSMSSATISKNLTAQDIAVSLGLYISDKNTGLFKDMLLTFSKNPTFVYLLGDIRSKINKLKNASWDMNTDLLKAIRLVLETAVYNKVPQSDMPKMLLILSDMQFDQASPGGLIQPVYVPNHTGYDYRPAGSNNLTALKMMQAEYAAAGYTMPVVVFWNLNAKDNAPVRKDESGVMLVSGYSPSILKSMLAMDIDSITPYNMMLKTVNVDRYDLKRYDAFVTMSTN